MPITTYRKEDLFDTPHKYIAHGCNAQGVMGSGVAKIVKEKYPEAFSKYNIYCDQWKHNHIFADHGFQTIGLLGQVVISEAIYPIRTILNCITQDKYGHGRRYVSYDAVDRCFQYLNTLSFDTPIAIPKIGSTLGGGNWKVIEMIINQATPKIQIEVYDPNLNIFSQYAC